MICFFGEEIMADERSVCNGTDAVYVGNAGIWYLAACLAEVCLIHLTSIAPSATVKT